MGENYKENSPKISHNFLDDNGAALVSKIKLKQVFRLTQNTFKRLLRNFKKYILTEFSTD